MKALSFFQPRAEQVVRGEKVLDIRSYTAAYRGRLAVHASSERRDARCRALGFDPGALAYGALVGSVELTEITALDRDAFEALRPGHLLESDFPGEPCYGWRLSDPRRLAQPVPCRGRMRLFEVMWPEDVGLAPAGLPAVERAAPEPDPQHPFVLYAVPESEGGYRVALYQWGQRHGDAGPRAPGALWAIELGGDTLRALADHLLEALRANGYRATDLARSVGGEVPFYLDELTGLRLALILMAVRPLTRHDRIEAIGLGVQAMSAEEAYYWFSKCSAGDAAARAQRALRVLLSSE